MIYNLSIFNKIRLFIKTFLQTIIGLVVIILRSFKKNKSINFLEKDKVSLVITSCNRFSLLKTTIESFKKYNTFKISKIIHIEDGNCQQSINFVKDSFIDYEIISILNTTNLGQLNSIDTAYSYVNSEYIFHLEEDWLFTESNFIEFSLDVLKNNLNCIFVSLRKFNDQNNHPIIDFNENFFKLKPFWKLIWIGFGFNPSLRRKSDYDLIGRFGGINKRETSIGLFYYIFKNKYVLVAKDKFFVTHSGWDNSTYLQYNKA